MSRPASSAAGARADGPELAAIWAQAHGRVIGRHGSMPWHCPADFAFFKEQTLGFPVVMGRATWESFPQRFRPLPGRTNVVLSGTVAPGQHEGAHWTAGLLEALATASAAPGGQERIWVLGGASLYASVLQAQDLPVVRAGRLTRCVVTELGIEVPGDAWAPELGPEWTQRDLGDGTDSRGRVAGEGDALLPRSIPYRFVEHRRS